METNIMTDMISRRGLLGGLFAITAPAIIRTPGLLMPVRPIPCDLQTRFEALTAFRKSWYHEWGKLANDLMIYGKGTARIDLSGIHYMPFTEFHQP